MHNWLGVLAGCINLIPITLHSQSWIIREREGKLFAVGWVPNVCVPITTIVMWLVVLSIDIFRVFFFPLIVLVVRVNYISKKKIKRML